MAWCPEHDNPESMCFEFEHKADRLAREYRQMQQRLANCELELKRLKEGRNGKENCKTY